MNDTRTRTARGSLHVDRLAVVVQGGIAFPQVRLLRTRLALDPADPAARIKRATAVDVVAIQSPVLRIHVADHPALFEAQRVAAERADVALEHLRVAAWLEVPAGRDLVPVLIRRILAAAILQTEGAGDFPEEGVLSAALRL